MALLYIGLEGRESVKQLYVDVIKAHGFSIDEVRDMFARGSTPIVILN